MVAIADACREIAERILEEKGNVDRIKKEISGKYGLRHIPRNSDILRYAPHGKRDILSKYLRLKPVRTISGVAVVSVMTSPERCPHGRCVPCPGGVESDTPQSYVGHEPAALRGRQHNFNPFSQVVHRVRQLQEIGHPVDKVELIVMGGTFTARDLCYQEWFVRECFNALNHLGGMKKELILEKAQKKNERARIRNTGITFETRPDWAERWHVENMLRFGGTKVELGVQSLYDFVLKRIERGHSVEDTVKATRLLKNAGFKVGYHMMPGLPGSSKGRDLRMFEKLFRDQRFRPDYLKIYPTLVIKGTKLYEMWRRGEYNPYTTDDMVDLISRVKEFVPVYVRIQRIQRDIPARFIEAGVRKSNLRQLVEERMRQNGRECRCIRCREVGHRSLHGIEVDENEAELVERDYTASDGREYFISYESAEKDVLFGFLRFRIPSEEFSSTLSGAGIVRELHIYGGMVPIGKSPEDEWQHRGFGRKMLMRAEEIAREEGCKKIAVISGVGVRPYYRRFKYRKKGHYMVKNLK